MLAPQTKLLITEYGNANFAFGELPDCPPVEGARSAERLVAAKDALVAHLEENYVPKP